MGWVAGISGGRSHWSYKSERASSGDALSTVGVLVGWVAGIPGGRCGARLRDIERESWRRGHKSEGAGGENALSTVGVLVSWLKSMLAIFGMKES